MAKGGLRLAKLQKIRSRLLAFSLKIQKDFHAYKKISGLKSLEQ